MHDDITHTVELAVHENRLLELEYWTQTEDRYSERVVEPYALFNGREAWYVAAWDIERGRLQHFRLDRIKRAAALLEHFEPREGLNPIADVAGWPRTGKIGGSRVARVLISEEQARWAREQRSVARGAAGRPDHRRDQLQEPGVPGPRGAQGGGRRDRARARRCPRGRAGRGRGPDRPRDMSNRRAAIAMSDDEVAAFLEDERVVTVASVGA